MSTEEVIAKQEEYKIVLGREPKGPHKNKISWLNKEIEKAKGEEVETTVVEAPLEAKSGFQIDRNVTTVHGVYDKDQWVDEDDPAAEILKQFKA